MEKKKAQISAIPEPDEQAKPDMSHHVTPCHTMSRHVTTPRMTTCRMVMFRPNLSIQTPHPTVILHRCRMGISNMEKVRNRRKPPKMVTTEMMSHHVTPCHTTSRLEERRGEKKR